jgi:hypothetical protein
LHTASRTLRFSVCPNSRAIDNWDLLQRFDPKTLLLSYCLSKSPAYTALMGDIETRLRQARAGGAVRRSETFFIPIASCLQGTILVPTPARLPARSRSRLTAVTGHGSRPTPARLRRSQVTGHRSRVTAVAGALSRVTAVTGHGGHAVTAVTRRLTQTHAGVSRLPS